MAASQPLQKVLTEANGTVRNNSRLRTVRKCSVGTMAESGFKRWMLVALCLSSIVVLFAPGTSALEHDSDLVFDDTATNGELFSNPDHHRGRQYRRHHNGTADDSRTSQDVAVAPVQSPEDADDAGQRIDDASSFGLFGSLRNLGRRVKKSVYRWLEGGDLEEEAVTEPTDGSIGVSTLRKKRSVEVDQDDQEANRISDVEEDDIIPGAVEQDAAADDDQLEEELDEVKKSTRGDIDMSPVEVDDEDYVNEPSGDGGVEGSGSVTDAPYVSSSTGRTPVSPGQPHYYRITFSINEPYQEEFEDRNSDQFQQIAKNLTQAVDALYDSVEGRQSSTLIKIEKTSDPFLCKVTLDLGTLDFYDRQVISSHLENQIINYRKLGSIPVTIDNFTLREFGDRGPGAPPTPQCAAQELPCRSGECLAPSTRCNGVKDCRDGSDEFGCPTNSEPSTQPTTPSTPGTTTTTISTTTSTSTARSFPIQDKCRADDKVRCADGSIYICRVHICDGNPDCPQGDDEKDCPLDECATGEFMCDLTRCIPASKRCDSQQDCTDGTDEQECPTERPSCGSDEFRCNDGRCIDDFRRCDYIMDCTSGEDEANCPNITCQSNEWQCDSGICIDSRLRCNNRQDCPNDSSDERNCHTCASNEFQCRDRTCINSALRCDRTYDCPDGSDEAEDICGRPPACAADQFRCNDGLCLNINQRCNNINECLTGEDERGCSNCTLSQFRCRDGRCVDLARKCDGNQDCGDASDEDDCGEIVAPCPGSDFTCLDGSCVPMSRRCDGTIDCPNGADEAECEDIKTQCKPGEFRCRDGVCISDTYVCDNVSDCGDLSDEQDCPVKKNVTTCRPDEITCGDGKCVDHSRKCDRIFDCIDGLDERDCGICSPSEFRCEDGTCISEDKRCDSFRDCRDGSDELDCACKLDEFKCGDGPCISESYRCDGIKDCTDGSDEVGCPAKTCSPNEFTCSDGTCIDSRRYCDGRQDCRDGSDEQCEPRTCASNMFTCGDGNCIDTRRICDGRRDCRDGSDEVKCGCQSNEFQCGSGECVPQSNLCNGNYDCHDGSDEHGCETTPRPTLPTVTPRPTPQCPTGQSACRTGNQCVSRSAICDGRYDCQDFSDEDDCGSKDGLNLKTYPEDQMIKEGREVVFQCRDEGPLRARVRWLRGNGLPLPPGSRDVSGRLEIPDIQVEHSGTYICEAVGFPQETQGARVSVHLTVDPFELPATRPPTACALNEATCSNGECIDKNRVCDGQYDCTDGSDEMRCNPLGCEPNEFRCNNKKCVLKTWRCDSDDDCGDGSDEANCATNPPGSPCRYHEFQCQTGNQCIPKSFHCDLEIDCQDGSDEVGCSASYIQVPPPPMVNLNIGSVFTITCTAIGVPTPEVVWRLNWGHIPPKCTTTSSNGLGTLTCPDVQESDQGAYSCEAINTKGSTFAIPDSILVVNKPDSVCPRGYFNEEASTRSDCISCFCFGVTTECKSADLFTYQLPPPLNQYQLVSVRTEPSISILPDPPFRNFQPTLRPLNRNGFQVYTSSAESPSDNTYLYFSLPENYNGNQLKSYGGYLKYTVNYEGQGRPISAPNVILSGNGYVLTHRSRDAPAGRDTEVTVRIFYGEWYKAGSPQSGDTLNVLATREEIMMALGDTTHVLIRSQYVDGTVLDTSVFNIALDSAGVRNTGLGQATFVEECRCPAGYTGLSCEQCAPGYNRRKSGPWLGLCTREPVRCPSGYYGDPSRNIPCQVCPCPLTNPSNQFGRTCQLDTDGDVTCDCPQGYIGRRCEQCAAGYQGNPLIPGDSCSRGSCDHAGSLSVQPNPTSGECDCKDYSTGSTCNQCKANTFFLDSNNQFGCISCFCMGITNQCQSSNWYREQVSVAFTRNTQGFKLVETLNRDEPITDNIHVDSTTRELVFQDFSRRTPDVYYWQLPTQFLGDKVTSYGGNLNYTVRYVPTPGGQSSRNSAPDVELLSSNDIRLLYFRREQIEPNQPQSISVPLLEQYWQRHDGQTANREHLLMALADLGSILIKATYTTNTREAALLGVTLDVAEERNTGQERALAVEQCVCPRGYRGLSCEDCDVGYTRALEGIYLGLCEQCNCNGHSSECNPDTGICQNCGDHTTGDQCDTCEDGYEGDATRGTPTDCQPSGRPTPGCSCDPRGSARSDCPDGEQCVCKTNVEGRSCDRCRPGTFALSSDNTEGCLECLCSGVTDSCQSSNYYRTQIPMQIIDSRHGFTLTDSSRNNVVRDGFSLNVAQNEIGYTFPNSRNQRMFWSLPPAFTGNKVSSYGGSLTVTQHYTARAGAERLYDTDVVISGNGISLYWTYQGDVAPDQPLTFTVPLREASWRRLGQTGPRSASRADLLTVLSNVEAILVRASHSSQTLSTYLSDVSLDTAVPQYTGQAVAIDVEACRCPEGYRGSSCELCAPGYYRDSNDRSASLLGSCTRCPCNNHEESCSATPDGRVSCSCQSGYTGRYCNSVEGLMMELVPVRVSQPIGTLVSFVCSYNSNEEMNIEFIEIPKPAVVQTTNGNNNLHHTHTITRYDSGAKRVWTVRITRWHKNVQCLVKNKAGNILGTLTSTINTDGGNGGSGDGSGDLTSSTTTTTLRPPPPPTISISVSEPTIQIVDVGSTVRYRCSGRSLITQRPVTLQWSKEGGELPRDRAIDDRQGVLVITDVRVSDSGTYICAASDGLTIVTERAVLTVGGSPPTPPQVVILPRYLEVTEGEPVEFRCEASGNPTPTLRWTARENKPLPSQASFLNGVFRIPAARKSDESEYECHASNPSGTNTQRTVLYVREGQPKPDPTSLTVEPNEYSGPGGETVRLTCLTGEQDRDYTIRWSRAGGRELPPSAVQRDGVLTIYNASPADSGVYVCTATSSYTGSVDEVQARVTIVSYRGPPTVRIEPDRQTISQGTRAELRCQASGDPAPQVRWTKVGEELSSLTQVSGSLLIINSAQVRDRGVYVCTAENEGGSAQSSAIVEVERQEPPSIELYPKGQQTVVEGGRALLQCRVTGGIPSPSIRWTRPNGLALSSSVEELPGGVLRFNHITKTEEGQYSCHAENNAGSTDAVATLLVQSLPKIVLSPSNTVHLAIGQSVRLECRATGDPIPSVSWTKYLQRAYPYGGTESIIPATPQTAVYEISRVTKEDEGSYNCQARNAAGFTEERLQLIVVEDNTIGGGSGSVGGGGGQGGSHRGDIPAGADDDDDGDDYEGSNQARPGSGSQSGGGSSTGGYPTYPGQGGQGYPPNGGVQVSDNVYRILEGGRAEMRCMVRGNRERIFLNWVRSDNGQMPSDHLVRDGVLYINNIEPSAAGEYSCQGIGQNGNVLFTATATLTVIAPPRIQLNPTRQVVRPGDNAYITCSATGDQPIDIVWTAEGRALPPSVSINQGLLQFRGIAVSDAGRYVCRARNSEGEAEAVAEVIVNEHTHEQPVVTAVQHEQSASLGSSVQLRCTVPPGSVRPRLTWRRERRPLPANAVTRGDGVLILNNVQVSDEGRYICEASSEYGVASDYVTLRVELQGEGCTWSKGFLCDNGECVPLSLVCDGNPDCRDGSDEVTCRKGRGVTNIALRIEPSQEIIQIGDNVDVRCSASSDTRIAYSWSKVGERLGNNVQVIDNLLRVSDVRPSNGGVYRCTARTRQGSYTEDYVLAIQDSPDMNRDAAAVETRTAPYGSTIEMDCHTDLDPPVTFSWSKQGGSLRRDTNTRTALLNIHDINANDAGTYVCTAQNAVVKMDIPTVLVVTGVVPYFAQAPLSYMMLPTLPDAYLKFDIEVSFKPESQDGLILYNGEMRGGEDDFISLGLNGSYVEFRFDVGSTPAMIRSARPIRIGEWHTVKIERNRKNGKMTVDNDGPFVGEAVGAFQGLDLVQPLYVGAVPNFKNIHRLNGFTSGFVGCISRLVIGRVESDLMRDATLSEGVTTCETCAVNPCHNQGVCQEAAQPQGYMCICPHGFSGINCQKVGEACFPGACGTGRCVNNDEGFKCYCPFGKSGNQCENDIDIIEPAFSDEAYLAYPTPKALRRLKLSLKFNPTDADDALLLYCAQDEDGNGDYTSLAIRDKRLEFKFDTGSGPAIIRSEREIIPGEWVTVLAGRNSRSGHLSINNDPAVSGNAPGTTKGLNLRTPLYVGGYDKQRVHLAQGVGVDKGFRGCVSEIIVSGMKMDIKDSVVDAANVQDCSSLHGGSTRSDSSSSTCNRSTCLNGGVCSENRCICPERFSGRNCEKEMNLCDELRPCQNGGTCIGSTSSYRCKCPLGYGGTNCHQIADFTTEVSFHKNGYLELKNSTLPHSSTTENEIINIEFSTTDQNGLIFWHGQAPETDGKGQDYLALAVVDGFLEFSYELGSGPAQIQINNVRVDDGKRHQVVLKRQASDGSINLDSNYTEFGESGGILKMLNTRGNIYIGGVPNFDLMTAGRYLEGFAGCIHSLQIQSSGDINLRESALSAVNALPCSNVSADEYNDVLGSLDAIVNK